MPRNGPVDYPQVHRPTAQPSLGFAPPQDDANHRFSWQANDGDGDQLEVGQERTSTIPPLPVLPQHLEEPILPSQRSAQLQQKSQFRPDIPRNLQQTQRPLPQGPTPSYEASEAAYRESRMQDQPVYNVPSGEQAQPAQAFPVRNIAEDIQDSQEEKPTQTNPIQIGPDANPLFPTSPQSVVTTNMRLFPPPRLADMHFDQPLSATRAAQSTRGGTWQHGLFSCADPTTCLSSLFCPCVVYGRTQYRLARKSDHKDPTNMLGFNAVNKSCLAWSVLCGVNVVMTSLQRRRIRKVYEMDETAGSTGDDCGHSCLCCCCVIAQDEKEMKRREKGGVAEGYQRTETMHFGVPN